MLTCLTHLFWVAGVLSRWCLGRGHWLKAPMERQLTSAKSRRNSMSMFSSCSSRKESGSWEPSFPGNSEWDGSLLMENKAQLRRDSALIVPLGHYHSTVRHVGLVTFSFCCTGFWETSLPYSAQRDRLWGRTTTTALSLHEAYCMLGSSYAFLSIFGIVNRLVLVITPPGSRLVSQAAH